MVDPVPTPTLEQNKNGNNGSSSFNGYNRPPVFGGENFEYWKDILESYFLCQDGDLWDLVLDGYRHPVNARGVKMLRQEMSDDQKKQFKNHHKSRTILLNAISHAEYEKITTRETAYDIFESLKMTHEDNA